jgi:hypothetical protein
VTNDPLITLLLRIGTVSAFCSIVAWVIIYTILAPWWRDPIGRALVIKSILIAALLIPTTLALFFHSTPMDSRAAAWVYVGLVGAITPAMIWRSVVWIKASRRDMAAGAPPVHSDGEAGPV